MDFIGKVHDLLAFGSAKTVDHFTECWEGWLQPHDPDVNHQMTVVKMEKKYKNQETKQDPQESTERLNLGVGNVCTLISNISSYILCSPGLSSSMCLFKSLQDFRYQHLILSPFQHYSQFNLEVSMVQVNLQREKIQLLFHVPEA